ncbi:STAS domain-containing protein [Streptomyces sp. NPDC001985]|uniref:STAS domain-containing protein n=1 Tax=Streptomyces sp. NPDC001985 TaxID=3154406 RepID=UPI00332CC691
MTVTDPQAARPGTRAVWVVRPTGDIDADSAPPLARTLRTAAARRPAATVVDLSATAFADSCVLHLLLDAQHAHRAHGAALVVAGPFPRAVARLFETTDAAALLTLADSAGDALRTLRTAPRN